MAVPREALEHRSMGGELLGRGLLVAARDQFRRWLELVESTGDPVAIVPALNALASVAHRRGELDEMWLYLRQAEAMAQSPSVSDDDRMKTDINLMTMYTERGRLEEALEIGQRAGKLPGVTDPWLGRLYWMAVSMIHWRRQEWVPLRQTAQKAYRLSVQVGDLAWKAKAQTNMGIAYLEMGAYRLAEKNLKQALSQFENLGSSEVAYTYAELGRLYFMQKEYRSALEAGRKALNALLCSTSSLDKEEVARVSRLFGIIFSISGHRNLSLKYLNRAAAYFSQLGLRAEWQRSTAMIGEVLSGQAQPARRQFQEEIQRLDFLTAVLDLTDDLESVDPYMRGHSERVAGLAVMMGEELGLSQAQLTTLAYAARLHDVGMVAVDAELVQREGPLTESERRRVAMHTTIGEEMVRPYGLPAEGLAAIRHHHERWDGSGSPDGLSATEIPLMARIVALAEVYDALTSHRVYRQAMTHQQAMAEMCKMSGRELDPILVERFRALHHV